MSEYKRGQVDGIRWAIQWLHKRAAGMNDPNAKAVLNSAAFSLGVEKKGVEIVPLARLRNAIGKLDCPNEPSNKQERDQERPGTEADQ